MSDENELPMHLRPVIQNMLPQTKPVVVTAQRAVRHKRRGTTYSEVYRAEVQTSRPIVEGDTVVIYVGNDGKAWARLPEEFDDGRFVPL